MSRRPPLTLPEFLELYPWPEEPLARGRPLEWLWHFDLDVQPEALWDYIADTSRFNRAIGLSEMHFEEKDGVLHGWSVNGGVRHEWVEVPWDWIAGRGLEAERIYSRGFAHFVRSIYRLEPFEEDEGEGHRLYVYFGWIPRGVVGKMALKIGMPSIEKGYRRVLGELARELGAARPTPYRVPPPEIHDEARARISRIRDQLLERGVPEAPLEKIIELVHTSDDMDAYRIQVRPLALEWGIDERELLLTCLHATRAGLLDLSWDVICPHCRGVRNEARSLGDVPSRGACDVCEIDFGTDAANAVEITFHIHPSIREVPKVYYCAAEPATKQHIKVQQALAPGERRELPTALAPGRYRLRLQGDRQGAELDVARGGGAGAVAWVASAGPSPEKASPAPRLTLENDGEERQTFVVELTRWADVALRPVHLFNLQEFRDLFTEEYLGADVQLSVGEQTILFTDMVGSTRFYAEHGDPAAFAEVKKHFVEVYAVIRRHRGVVVKTIGDAAMGAFSDPADAVRAAREIHRRFPPREAPDGALIRLRISLNTGPCIAVNLNSSIDYFGGTVNVAAKLQACAGAGDIAMSRAVREAPGVSEVLEREKAELEEGVYESEALDPVPYALWRTDGR